MKNIILESVSIEDLKTLIEASVRKAVLEIDLPASNPDTGDLLTVDQAAQFLSLSKPTIYSKKSRGELPCMKRGKRVYFSKSDLMKYLRGEF